MHRRFLFSVAPAVFAALAVAAEVPHKTADDWIAANFAPLAKVSDSVWDFAETAFQEHKSSRLLADTLEKAGFTVRRGVAGMKTAFVAEFGAGKPTIAFLAEYDALPGLSQKVSADKDPREAGRPGHGCGHNLLGTASVFAGIAVKRAMEQHKLPGRIIVFGTPAEEGGAGKVYMVREGLFAGVDVVVSWHPGTGNTVGAGSCLAVKRARFRFHGLAAHAAGGPERGRSALDAVELMNVGSNYLREHVPQQTRIHYVIINGGKRPNIVPEEAESWYYVRAPKMDDAQAVFTRVVEIAQGACLMTRTKVEIRDESGTYEILPNLTLAGITHGHLRRVGAPAFDKPDYDLARALRKTVGLDPTGPEHLMLDNRVSEISTQITMGSTDVGDVSWTVPTAEFSIAARAVGAPTHSWPFVATAGSPVGHKACSTAARVMAGTALELMTSPDVLKSAQEEFRRRTERFVYKCGIPAGQKPPEKIDE